LAAPDAGAFISLAIRIEKPSKNIRALKSETGKFWNLQFEACMYTAALIEDYAIIGDCPPLH